MDLNGVAAIVTGGASGLGAATSRRLITAGAEVMILDVQDELGQKTAEEIGAAYLRTDVTQEADVASAVAEAVEMGPLRVLVNCAGIGPPLRTLGRDGTPHDLAQFTRVVTVNLIGTFNCIRLAAAAMAETEALDEWGSRGAIVNTASVAAYEGQVGQAAYSASKGGVVGMTIPVARDLASIGVRVNTIAPGLIDTPLLAGLPEPARLSLGSQVLFPPRLGRPDEYAELAHLLLTHDYMNGETVRMDGGIRMGPK
ncbi:MAG TPA: SDR family NAD(P)-dependent oxidoreductase [Acidimicrobiia bacterium]|nr:SDR family NAD(P)-dependent oxidoreductase [Acidimicrobiia bacterium]